MTLDEQIKIAKDEKIFNEAVNELTAEIDELEKKIEDQQQNPDDAAGDTPNEANIYALNYSDSGEKIADYDYEGKLDVLKDKDELTVMEAIRLGRVCDFTVEQLSEGKSAFYRAIAQIRENCENAKNTIAVSQNVSKLTESYRYLAKVQVLLEKGVVIKHDDDEPTTIEKIYKGLMAGNASQEMKDAWKKEYNDYKTKNKKPANLNEETFKDYGKTRIKDGYVEIYDPSKKGWEKVRKATKEEAKIV